MVFFRNVQVRWMPLKGQNESDTRVERPAPAATRHLGDRIELQNIKGASRCPTSRLLQALEKWGYVRVAGMLREIKWDDLLQDQFDCRAAPPAGD
jgi:hypothetical protein